MVAFSAAEHSLSNAFFPTTSDQIPCSALLSHVPGMDSVRAWFHPRESSKPGLINRAYLHYYLLSIGNGCLEHCVENNSAAVSKFRGEAMSPMRPRIVLWCFYLQPSIRQPLILQMGDEGPGKENNLSPLTQEMS